TLKYSQRFSKAYPGSIHSLEGVALVVNKRGKTATHGSELIITGADQILLLVDISLLYDPDRSEMKSMLTRLKSINPDYEQMLTRHARIHGALFNRVRLDLGGRKDRKMTTEDLFQSSTDEKLNPALIEKEFDAGRYNIISCTGQLPPVLQGVWAGTYAPDWASDFTHNGNVPSAISAMLMGNTPELMLAYTSYIESLVPWLEINARHLFGARGVVLPSRCTTNGYNNALAPNFAGGFWVAGAAWAAHFFYDYYLYTGDKKYLAEHALPFMEKAALFFEDYLYEGQDGKYIFSPTQSPENTPGNTNSQGTFNATMDVAAAKELFHNLIAASRIMNVNQNKIVVWRRMLEKMPDYMISNEGVVKEWLTPKLEDRLNHRHSSQLYPLFYMMPDEIAQSPKLQEAFKRIIEIKLDKHWSGKASGFMSFGIVQLGQAATNLGEAQLAYRCLVPLVNNFWLPNLASMHNRKSLFNMDISGGMPTVVIQMLVSSAPGKITLLPALPAAWPKGSIEGILCRGRIEVKKLSWNRQKVTVNLLSSIDQRITLQMPGETRYIALRAGELWSNY
ncbi:MAG: glycoside hydrolase family 95 protein, partial [Bacteroidales bacterium]|nr:glycoside hydrolase family 95 protein [Bacteroidales bacterium]